MSEFYTHSAKTLAGEDLKMDRYAGQVVLIVNTASKCGFTPQYAGLQELHEKYADAGLAILGFPCNQFGAQEPGDAKSIEEGCLVNYGVSFQMFDKIEVNGGNAHPLFKYLKDELPSALGKGIKWNFTKFLIDRDGKPLRRFAPNVTPQDMEKKIQKLLAVEPASVSE